MYSFLNKSKLVEEFEKLFFVILCTWRLNLGWERGSLLRAGPWLIGSVAQREAENVLASSDFSLGY